MSNEVKIGILAVVAIALSLWGYKFIMGKNALTSSNLYYVEYQNVEGLQKATPVRISGFQVGVVADIYLKPDDPKRMVVVMLDLNKDIRIPKNTKAVIISTSIMGGKAIVLDYAAPCSGNDCAPSGSYLQGESRGLMASMLSEDQAKTYVNVVKEGLNEILDTLNESFLDENSDSPIALSIRDLRYTMANLKSSSSELDVILQRSSKDIQGTFKNLNGVTNTLQANNEKIKEIIVNAENFSADLAKADLHKTADEVVTSIKSLQSTLHSADAAIKSVNLTMGKINAGEGTLGKLLKDETLYYDLRAMATNVDTLVNDLQSRPYRYIPFKSKRKVEKYDRAAAKKTEYTNAAAKTDSLNQD